MSDRNPVPQRGMRNVMLSVLLILALLGFSPAGALAAPGDLDTTFGTGGEVSTDLGAEDIERDVAVDSSGRVVVVGDSELSESELEAVVVRYTAAGSLDPTFGGGDGIVTLHFGTGTWDDAAAVAIDGSGRIVIAGRTASDPACTGYCDFAAARLTSSGQLDPTFGGGDGKVTTDLGPYDLGAADLAIDSGGRIVIGGASAADFAILRYTESGMLDPSFDANGVVTTDFGGSADYVAGLTLDSNGRIVATGYSSSSNGDFAVARYLSTGELDPSFSGDGRVVTDIFSGDRLDFLNAGAVDAHNRVVVAGSSVSIEEPEGHLTVLRYTSSGALDSTFGEGGIVMAGTNSAALGIAVDDSERTLVVGYSTSIGGGDILIRYRPDGSFDPSFGGGSGFVAVPFLLGNDVTTDPAQRIVVAGSSYATDLDFAVTRYLGDAAPGPSPAPSSPPSAPAGSPSAPARPVVPTTRLGTATINGAKRVATFRFSGQGATALTFQCKIDRGPFKPCRSPKTYRKLKPGWHVFRVRARDALGQTDKTPAVKRFRVPKS